MTILSRFAAAAAAVFVGAFAAAPAAQAQGGDPVFGLWLVESERAIVRIAPCGSNACGNVVWMLEPNDAQGRPRLDSENEDASLRSRPLCGLPMIGNFVRTSEGNWEDGFIYDALEGDVYDAYLEYQGGDRLKVRGFLGVSLLGRSQIWTRVANNRGGC